MSFDFLDRRSAERFAELLDEPTRGGRHHSRVPADEQLAELVAIGHSLSAARPAIQVDPEFRVGLRAMLVATADRDGIGRTDHAVEAEPAGAESAAPARAGLSALIFGQSGRRIRTRGAIVIGVAAGAMAVSGISAASENASPGGFLYPVKRSTERAQLAMAGSDITRGQLSLDFARTRLAEAAGMPGDSPGFAGVLADMDNGTRKGVRLLDTSAVARRDVKPLATVDTFVAGQRQILTPALARLSPVNRERAMDSLTLLEAVTRRSDDLRAGLNCATVVSAGTDILGPKLRDCTTTADGTATARPSGHSGKVTAKTGGADETGGKSKTRAVPTEPAVATPGTTARPTVVPDEPDAAATAVTDLAPAAGTPVTSAPAGATTEEKKPGALGGLLEKLLGSG